MLDPYTVNVLEESSSFFIAAFIPPIVYWVVNHNSPFKRKVILSIPNIIIVMSFIAVAIISAYTTRDSYEIYWWIYQGLLLIGLISILFTYRFHKGNKQIHMVHIFTLFAAVIFWAIGGMGLSHDWL